jgi:hypothetical protein
LTTFSCITHRHCHVLAWKIPTVSLDDFGETALCAIGTDFAKLRS